ncbi:MAG: hypothetical protein LKJ25_09040 [Clostridia bacterium]|jgi:hypothetical protein|nr:hypothetical protein [Clostridia bacterium]
MKKKESIINPEFKTSIHMTDKTISDDELCSLLEKNKLRILSAIRSKHMLRDDEFSFVTYANFSAEYKCSIHNDFCKKNDEEIQQSKQNLKTLNDFLKNNYKKEVNMSFAFSDSDERCLLYDSIYFDDISKLNNYLKR